MTATRSTTRRLPIRTLSFLNPVAINSSKLNRESTTSARQTAHANDRRFNALMFVIGATLLVYGSLVPFHFRSLSLASAVATFRSLCSYPWVSSGGTADWSLNLTFMIPLGFFGMGALLDGRNGRWFAAVAVPAVMAACLALSMAVEFAQLWSIERVPSCGDIIAQTIGALVGVFVWLAAGRRLADWRRKFALLREPQSKFAWLLQAYVLGLLIYSVVPVDITTSPSELATKYRNGMIEIVPFSYDHGSLLKALYDAMSDVLLYVPVGMSAVLLWNPQGRSRRSAFEAILAGIAFACGVELIQLLIVNRYTSSTDVILGSIGVIIGVLAIHLWRQEDELADVTKARGFSITAMWLLGALVYSMFLAFVFWTPFDFTSSSELIKSRLGAFVSIPFARMHEGSDLQGLSGVMRKFLWFAPLGAMFAAAIFQRPLPPLYRRALLALATMAITGVALAVEVGQVLLPDKVADSTDVLLTAAGGLAGLLIVSRVLYKPRGAFVESELN
jgi:glycopeptide antibiotics resistance protein